MVFLCSKYADHITGQIIYGGWGEQQQLKKLDKKRNFSIILEKAKKFITSLPFCFFWRKEGAIMSSIKRLCMLETNEFLSYQPYFRVE